jgi:phosphate transport system substrate-binding protein
MTKSVPLIEEVKYLPLPEAAYKDALDDFKKGQTGTVFGGVPEVGLSIEELMKRERRS